MKLLLVLSSDTSYHFITNCLKPLGFEFVRYLHVLKAMDNIDEVDPQGVIISAVDFPRHWKIMVQFVRNERVKDICPIIILKGNGFTLEDSAEASFLGVSGTVIESLDNPAEIDRLQNILSRYLPVEEKRRSRRYYTEPKHGFGFVFVHPTSTVLVTGEVKDISSGGISFLPDDGNLMKDINLDTILESCSLRAVETILSPVCRLARTGRKVSIEFKMFPSGEQNTLDESIKRLLHGELGLNDRE